MTQADLDRLAEIIGSAIKKSHEKSAARIKALEQKYEELEKQKSAISYEGVFDAAKSYATGQFVTFHGSLWHANVPSCGRHPGERGSEGYWTLAVKRGRDGKDK
jgi:hypothetical protein